MDDGKRAIEKQKGNKRRQLWRGKGDSDEPVRMTGLLTSIPIQLILRNMRRRTLHPTPVQIRVCVSLEQYLHTLLPRRQTRRG